MSHRHDQGFALGEALMAGLLGAVVLAGVLVLLVRQSAQAQAHPDRADQQQRARAAIDVLSREIEMAGAGADIGGAEPPLLCCVPVVQPRRIGGLSPDAPGTVRPDVITIVRVRAGAIAARLAQPITGGALWLAPADGCPTGDPACGIGIDDHVVVFEPGGRHDFLLPTAPLSSSVPVTPRQTTAPDAYAGGGLAVAVETHTLYFDAASHQLRRYDGHLSDVPVIDDVAAVRFEYWGTASAPARSRLEDGVETCWFDDGGQPRHGRPTTGTNAPDVRLGSAELGDGPWCGAGDNRFDADLLRIRRVRATIHLRAPERARGRGGGFADPGTATDPDRLVPDLPMSIEVAPRALSFD